jgi:hypothetical protein
MIDKDCIEIYDFNDDNLTIHYGCKDGTNGKFKIKVIDPTLSNPYPGEI